MSVQKATDQVHKKFLSKIQHSLFKNQVLKAYTNLHLQIDQMTQKVLKMVEKDQSQFVTAYNNHVAKLRKELEVIKNKVEEMERELKGNDWILFIQKEMTLFREESLKLYDKLEEKTHQVEHYKIKCREAEKTVGILQKEVKEHLKNKKLVDISLSNSQTKIAELQQQIREKQEKLRQLNHHGNFKTQPIERIKLTEANSSLVFKMKDTTRLSTRERNTNSMVKNRTICNSRMGRTTQLQQWFLDCVRAVKREIANRKNNGLQLNLNTINNIEEFKMVDKLKLLEKFIENEKLLVWMYEKIFPSRINEVSEYLSNRKTCETQPAQEQISSNQEDHMKQFRNQESKQRAISSRRINMAIPLLGSSHIKRMRIGDRVSMTEGKLNISTPKK